MSGLGPLMVWLSQKLMATPGLLHLFNLNASSEEQKMAWSLYPMDRTHGIFITLAYAHLDETCYNFTGA